MFQALHKKTKITRAIKIIDKGKFFEKFVENDFEDVDEIIKKEFDLLRTIVFYLDYLWLKN